MRLNWTPESNVMTSWISREPPLFNFNRLDILCPRIQHPCENLWPHEFSRASNDQFQASRYIMRLNRTPEGKVITSSISREPPLYNFDRLDILCPRIGHPCENYDRMNSREVLVIHFECLDISYARIRHPSEKLRPCEFSRASVVQFLACRYILRLNQTPEWKVMTSWISREPPLYNFYCLDILYPRIRHPCEILWPHEFSRASGDQFWASRYIIRQNRISEWKVMTIRILESIRCSIF